MASFLCLAPPRRPIQGSVINTKHGDVKTDFILFICSGAFHVCKPSDLLAEFQGRLPIRVELQGLSEDDMYRILTEPVTNLIAQQVGHERAFAPLSLAAHSSEKGLLRGQ